MWYLILAALMFVAYTAGLLIAPLETLKFTGTSILGLSIFLWCKYKGAF